MATFGDQNRPNPQPDASTTSNINLLVEHWCVNTISYFHKYPYFPHIPSNIYYPEAIHSYPLFTHFSYILDTPGFPFMHIYGTILSQTGLPDFLSVWAWESVKITLHEMLTHQLNRYRYDIPKGYAKLQPNFPLLVQNKIVLMHNVYSIIRADIVLFAYLCNHDNL